MAKEVGPRGIEPLTFAVQRRHDVIVVVRRLSREELTELMAQIKVDYLWWRP